MNIGKHDLRCLSLVTCFSKDDSEMSEEEADFYIASNLSRKADVSEISFKIKK
jgi:hypothetical protein